jgi:multidrug efflux pump
MGQITGAIIGITLVLVAVFVPMAFFSGSVGAIYRQFSLTMVSSMLLSALLALTLTPALCATMLKPVPERPPRGKARLLRLVQPRLRPHCHQLPGLRRPHAAHRRRYMLVYGLILLCVGLLYARLPTSFLPAEDQGYAVTNIQLPPGASASRTEGVIQQVEQYYMKEKNVAHIVAVRGFSFSGSGQNAGLAFTPFIPWDERKGADQGVNSIVGRAFGALSQIKDAIIFPVNPPPIPELGNATGFTFRLQDRAGRGHDALLAARNQLLGMAGKSQVLAGVRPEGLEDTPQLQLNVDRDKANALGVAFADINATLSTAFGSSYINDFPNAGRLQRVIVQADAADRLQPEDIGRLYARNTAGDMVPFSSFSTTTWTTGPVQLTRYNGYPAMKYPAMPRRAAAQAKR